jgi:hypothetical protein
MHCLLSWCQIVESRTWRHVSDPAQVDSSNKKASSWDEALGNLEMNG